MALFIGVSRDRNAMYGVFEIIKQCRDACSTLAEITRLPFRALLKPRLLTFESNCSLTIFCFGDEVNIVLFQVVMLEKEFPSEGEGGLQHQSLLPPLFFQRCSDQEMVHTPTSGESGSGIKIGSSPLQPPVLAQTRHLDNFLMFGGAVRGYLLEYMINRIAILILQRFIESF
jgi:hypothetical protein